MEEDKQNPNQDPFQSSPVEQTTETPPQQTNSKLKLPIVAAMLILLAIVGTASAVYLFLNNPSKQKACTQEAKICPDGSSVGRTGPNCEFTPCPTGQGPSGPVATGPTTWKTYINSAEGFSLKYPPDWSIADESSVTNGVSPSFSKTIVQGEKPVLISILKFNSAEYGSEKLKNFAPFTFQEGASVSKETEEAAFEILDKIASAFEFTNP